MLDLPHWYNLNRREFERQFALPAVELKEIVALDDIELLPEQSCVKIRSHHLYVPLPVMILSVDVADRLGSTTCRAETVIYSEHPHDINAAAPQESEANNMSQKRAGQSQVVIAVILFGVAMTGCVLITPTTKQIESVSGRATKLPKHPPIPGKTTRRDVDEHYEDVAVETGVPNLFWGRFRKSAWQVSVGNYTTSYSTRIWGVKNILISFDKDAVKSYEIVEGDKYLFNRLLALLKEQEVPPLDLTQPVTVRGWYAASWECRITIDLNASEVVVTKALPRKSWKEPAPPPQVARIPVAQVLEVVLGQGRSDADLNVGAAFRFVEKTDVGKEVAFKTPPEAAVVLARWMEQVGLEKGQR